jgi:hypothetical protein
MSEGLSVDPNPGAIRMRRARDRKRQGRFASASWLAQTRSPASLRVVGLILANAVRQQSGRLPLLASLGIRLYARATNYQAIRDELLELAVDDPYESTEYQGMVDFHWGFDRMSKADQLAGSLREFAEKPEVVVLRVTLRNRAARDIVAGARSSLDRNPQHLRDHGGQFR